MAENSENKGGLVGFSRELADAAAQAGRSVVRVNARRRMPGSGTVWTNDGVVVTADHVVEVEEGITLALPDGGEAEAELVGRDPGSDLAVLRTSSGGLAPAQPAAFSDLRVGQLVLAVGRSWGASLTATVGVVSTLTGPWRTWRRGTLDNLVLSDVTLFPGFSGGPLVDVSGRVLGVNSSLLARGVGAALPSELVERVVRQLLAQGRVRRGYLGVSTYPVALPRELAERHGLNQRSGLLINGVEPGSPAERAGLLLGDVLVGLEGQPIADADDLQGLLGPERVGVQVALSIIRGGELRQLPATVGERE
ncbi:MAG: S1C family serine protease [Chloroflexi bacterium]|nr:S1C family serine protease [Chloroflexota bacterium]MCL5111121.1 S1C family serine protease [Chloroflexota bacterium]